MTEIRKRFGARMRALRRERGWTQKQLADASGVSARSISSIENGIYSVTLDTAARIARGLGVPLAILFET